MSDQEDLSFLNLPTFKSFKVKSGRTYIQLDNNGNSIAVSFSTWKDEKTHDFVTGIIIRPVLRVLKHNADECKDLLEAGCQLDVQSNVIRKQKTLQPTHWGFAAPHEVLATLDHWEFFPRLMETLKSAYGVDFDATQFKQFIIVSDPVFAHATVKDFREVVDIAL